GKTPAQSCCPKHLRRKETRSKLLSGPLQKKRKLLSGPLQKERNPLKVAVWTTSEGKKPAQSCCLDHFRRKEARSKKKPAQSCFLEHKTTSEEKKVAVWTTSEGKKPAQSCCLDHFRRKETRSKLLSGPLQKERNPLKVAVWTTSERKKPAQSCCLEHFGRKPGTPLEGISPARSCSQELPWKKSHPHEVVARNSLGRNLTRTKLNNLRRNLARTKLKPGNPLEGISFARSCSQELPWKESRLHEAGFTRT
ncbi:4285_t:CDS:2, partial [Dentiscutata heterogama]